MSVFLSSREDASYGSSLKPFLTFSFQIVSVCSSAVFTIGDRDETNIDKSALAEFGRLMAHLAGDCYVITPRM